MRGSALSRIEEDAPALLAAGGFVGSVRDVLSA